MEALTENRGPLQTHGHEEAYFASLLDAMTRSQSRTWCFFKNFFVKYLRYLQVPLRVIHSTDYSSTTLQTPPKTAERVVAGCVLQRTNAHLFDIDDSEVTVTFDLSRVIFTASPRFPVRNRSLHTQLVNCAVSRSCKSKCNAHLPCHSL